MSGSSSVPAGQTSGGSGPSIPNDEDDVFAPGGRLPPRFHASGKLHKKEVNFPDNATMERGRGATYIVTTSRFGALRLPGDSCTDPNCECGHRAWPTTGGELALASCNVMCEICGLLRPDFRVNVANLRRHVREQHLYEDGGGPDPTTGRLYGSVKASRKQKPRKKRAKSNAEEEPADDNDDEVDNEDSGMSSVAASGGPSSGGFTSPLSAPLSEGFSSGAFANSYAQQYEQNTFPTFPSGNFLPSASLPPFTGLPPPSAGFPSFGRASNTGNFVPYSGIRYDSSSFGGDLSLGSNNPAMSANPLRGSLGGTAPGLMINPPVGNFASVGGNSSGRGGYGTGHGHAGASSSVGWPAVLAQGQNRGVSSAAGLSGGPLSGGRGFASSGRSSGNIPDNINDDEYDEEEGLFVS